MSEQDYINGKTQAYRDMLSLCVRELAEPGVTVEKLLKERADTLLVIRRICEDYGDNEWPDDLHLGDALSKHLERHLWDSAPDEEEESQAVVAPVFDPKTMTRDNVLEIRAEAVSQQDTVLVEACDKALAGDLPSIQRVLRALEAAWYRAQRP